MLEIRYSRWKLWATAVFCGLFTAWMLWLFLIPNLHVRGFWGLFVNGGFGHFVTLPILVLSFAVSGFRAAWMGAGATDAIVADRDGVIVTTMWRVRSAEWRDVMQVRVVEKQVRRNKSWHLVIDRRDGGSFELPLAATELPKYSYYELGQALAQMHLEAIRSPLVKPAVNAPTPASGIPAATPEFPARPSFGRKAG